MQGLVLTEETSVVKLRVNYWTMRCMPGHLDSSLILILKYHKPLTLTALLGGIVAARTIPTPNVDPLY